jgi:polar amino acid transport system substrate-binding protein
MLIVLIPLFATDVTIVGDATYPPYSFEKNGQPAGIYTEILKEAFKKLDGYNVTIEMQPWKRGLKNVENGKILALFPPYYRPEERPFIKPYSTPIFDEKIAVICAKETGLNAQSKWPEDFYGKTIGINAGFSLGLGGKRFVKAVEDGKIKVEYANSNETNIKKLKFRRIDAYLNDKLAIIWTVNRLKMEDASISIDGFVWGPITSEESGYLGYTAKAEKFPYKQDFITRLDKIIDDMKKNGEIDEIMEKFLNSN